MGKLAAVSIEPHDPPGPPREKFALHALFAYWARHTPSAPAVIDAAGTHTYDEVWRRSGRIAARLLELGVRQEEVVATLLPRSVQQVAALLGILRSGGALLALDRAQWGVRCGARIANADVRVIIIDAAAEVPEDTPLLPLAVEALETGAEPSLEPVPVKAHRDGIACVLYTSGSTGQPKGVLLTHAAVTTYARHQAKSFALTGADRIAQRAPYTSDAALSELVMAFAVGGAAVVVPLEALATPDAFVRAVEGQRVSMLTLVPSLLVPLLADGVFARCPSLRVVVSVGEQLTMTAATQFARQSTAALFNLYGPSEAGIGVTAHRVTGTEIGPAIPVGHAAPGLRLHVCGPNGDPLPCPEPGELYVGGNQLARGYLGHPALTAGRFVPDAFSGQPGARLYRTGDLVRQWPDGTVEFLGRIDDQLKLRGVRVEPSEIESAIRAHPRARQAAIVLVTASQGADLLVAFVQWDGAADSLSGALRPHLRGMLPGALIPAIFHAVPSLPLLPSGKTDRRRLTELATRLQLERTS